MTNEAARSSYACTRHTAQVFSLRVGYDYAVFSLGQFGPQYFMLAIESSYGGYAYAWSHPGTDFYRFLARLDRCYVSSKLCSGEQEVYDAEATAKHIREQILGERRSEALLKEEARDEWDLVRDQILGEESIIGFDQWSRETGHFRHDYWEMAIYRPGRRANEFAALYDKFWPSFAAELLKAAPTAEEKVV